MGNYLFTEILQFGKNVPNPGDAQRLASGFCDSTPTHDDALPQ